MLTGVSVDYYVRLERGNLAGASESVLDSLANTLKLDEAERQYLFDLARSAGPARKRRSKPATTVRPCCAAGARRDGGCAGLGAQRAPRHPRGQPAWVARSTRRSSTTRTAR